MEETNSTTETTSNAQTTPETSNTQITGNNETLKQVQGDNSQPDDVQEPENNENVATENVDKGKAQEEPKNWEKIAKDNQASFTKISQEKAELTKRIEELESKLKPKVIQDGKINPDFEKRYQYDIDNQEYLAFDSLARQLDTEQRAEVEKLLLEAKALYNPNNNQSYFAKLNQIKDYFRSDIVEAIAVQKRQLQSNIKSEFEKELAKDKQQRADKVAAAIEQVPEIKDLVVAESENYTPEVFNIVKTMFDLTGDVDIEGTKNAITKIKELGVKEYLAREQASAQKQNATVPSGSGDTVLQKNVSTLPTAEEIKNTPGLYTKLVKQFKGDMSKVDAILAKGL